MVRRGIVLVRTGLTAHLAALCQCNLRCAFNNEAVQLQVAQGHEGSILVLCAPQSLSVGDSFNCSLSFICMPPFICNERQKFVPVDVAKSKGTMLTMFTDSLPVTVIQTHWIITAATIATLLAHHHVRELQQSLLSGKVNMIMNCNF